jgi:hypothetical protein
MVMERPFVSGDCPEWVSSSRILLINFMNRTFLNPVILLFRPSWSCHFHLVRILSLSSTLCGGRGPAPRV